MYISKIKIENYKGFNNHDTIELKQGINLIIGKNNSGKTALLEALTFRQIDKPYLSESNLENCSVWGQLTFEFNDIMHYLHTTNTNIFSFPNVIFPFENIEWEEIDSNVFVLYHYIEHYTSEFERIELEAKNITIDDFEKLTKVFFENKIPIKFNVYKNTYIIDLRKYSDYFLNFVLNDKKIKYIPEKEQKRDSVQKITEHNLTKNIYKFDIHRKVEAKSSVSENSTLYNDCRNLASVLDTLQGDRKLFSELENKFRYIFPEIKELTLQKAKDKNVELKVWNTESKAGKPYLAKSLDDCGTGIGQVLSILYVVVSSTEPKVILIDEPNSFLHPSASRKLMEVLTEYPQHQYCITTHSPELISNFGDNILHTQLIDGKIRVKQIDKKDKEQIEDIFSDLGIRLSDVYGFDSVFWVEGETEEKCLPLILKQAEIDISNIGFISVKKTGGTGKFKKDFIKTTISIYNRLSTFENSYIPAGVGYFFDREFEKVEDIYRELPKKDREKVVFTDKTLYENYLLNEDAIFQLLETERGKLLSIDSSNTFSFTQSSVLEWIKNNKFEKKYWNNKEPNETQKTNWKDEIHASELLSDLFKECFGSLNPYHKTKHSVELTKIILNENPEIFKEFVEKISKIIK
jgi:predicted ATPase